MHAQVIIYVVRKSAGEPAKFLLVFRYVWTFLRISSGLDPVFMQMDFVRFTTKGKQ